MVPNRAVFKRIPLLLTIIAASVSSGFAAPCDELLDSIEPCTCFISQLECSAVESGEQLLTIRGLHNGQSLNFSTIIIRDNARITEIPARAFGDHSAFYDYIFVRNPYLWRIDPTVFSPQSAETLVAVDASENALTSFPFEIFEDNEHPKLQVFAAHSNRIASVPGGALQNVSPVLQYVYLYDNWIENVGPNAFRGLPALRDIVLYSNRLTTLPADSMAFSSRPSTLTLYDNFIRNFEKGFAGNLPFETVLEDNQIETLEEDIWGDILLDLLASAEDQPDGHNLDFAENPFVCDCRMKWLHDNITVYDQFIRMNLISCSNADGMPFSSLTDTFFEGC